MPRPRKPGGPEPKRRSRNGCWPCKTKKVKCGEERPSCTNCVKEGGPCDYSIRLNWNGRGKRKAGERTPEPEQWLSVVKHEDSIPLLPPESQPETAGADHAVVAARPASVSDLTADDPDSGKPKEQYVRTGTKIEVDDASLLQPYESQTATHPLDLSATSCDSESPLNQKTLPSESALPTPVIQRPMHLAHYTNHRVNVSSHRGPLLKETMAAGSDSSRLRKRSRTDPPPVLKISDQNSDHRYSLSPFLARFPQMSPLPIGSTKYRSGDSSSGVPPSISSATSILSNDTSTGGSSRSMAWSVSPTPKSPTDTRRLSVNALLSSPRTTKFASQSKVFGTDHGFLDLDIPHNKDMNVLDSTSKLSNRHTFSDASENCDESPLAEFGFGLYGKTVLPSGGEFYASPVSVEIERNLEPLPAMLLENQMNLLYFHHFINHTARILVPHDCPENPFRTILPQMAVRDTNLMHLLLTYSACHRARLLKHPEPTNRIAIWVSDVFPSIRNSLSRSTGQASTTNLAALIMLASLEIIAPAAFEFVVPWQEHLNAAREIIKARGPPQAGDRVAYFLNRWFVYLDVLGSLSGATNTPELSDNTFFHSSNEVEDVGSQIDCLFGFTSSCISILSEIAKVARRCDVVRIDAAGSVRRAWQPTEGSLAMANGLKNRLEQARTRQHTACLHRRRLSITEELRELQEMAATNDAFHWAGLIHIACRILGKSYRDVEVVHALQEIKAALTKVRRGGTAEACLLFPMFTAGCTAYLAEDREFFLDRITSMEGSGMAHVQKARKLMQRVWETGRPWETLVQGEFFG